MIRIAPSILSSDFSMLGEEVKKVDRAGADLIHVDVMDGHFVPNITIGPAVVKSIRHTTGLLFDVHLMIENPENYIDSFIDAGADIVSVHAEACTHLHRVIQQIKSRGKRASVALNPATSLSVLEYVLQDVDMVLLMTVNPGFGGQSYIEAVTEKVRALSSMIKERKLKADIEVDGGIDLTNIRCVTEAGANVIVAGTTIFRAVNMTEIIRDLRENAFKESWEV